MRIYKRIPIKCPVCEETRQVIAYSARRKGYTGRCPSCNGKAIGGQAYRAENHPRWKGGRYKDKSGYIIYTLRPEDDFFQPMATPSNNRVAEHRFVMAKHLKRCLFPWEVVHHKNGIKDDNSLANLQLLPERRFHLIDNKTKSYIAHLQQDIKKLREKVSILEKKQ